MILVICCKIIKYYNGHNNNKKKKYLELMRSTIMFPRRRSCVRCQGHNFLFINNCNKTNTNELNS